MKILKEPLQCIPVSPIKDQVEQRAFDIRFHSSDISAKTWSRYPCKLNAPKKCQNDHCQGNVSFLITNNALKDVKILTLLFAREHERAYVYYNRQLRSLFEDGILSPITPVTINLKPPVISEPVKRINLPISISKS